MVKSVNDGLRQYYRDQLARITPGKAGEYPAKIKIVLGSQQATNWLDMNDATAQELSKWLDEYYNSTSPIVMQALKACVHFIEDVTDDDPERQNKFFACRQLWRQAFNEQGD